LVKHVVTDAKFTESEIWSGDVPLERAVPRLSYEINIGLE
jgi:hypothetical protein